MVDDVVLLINDPVCGERDPPGGPTGETGLVLGEEESLALCGEEEERRRQGLKISNISLLG